MHSFLNANSRSIKKIKRHVESPIHTTMVKPRQSPKTKIGEIEGVGEIMVELQGGPRIQAHQY